jgi:hypothetical protein
MRAKGNTGVKKILDFKEKNPLPYKIYHFLERAGQ